MKKTLISLIIAGIISPIAIAGNYVYRAPVSGLELGEWTTTYEYTDWVDSGDEYDCESDIQSSDLYYGKTGTQTQTCSQKQTRTKTTVNTNSLGEENSSSESETQVVSVSNEEAITGTYLASSCKTALAFDSSLETGKQRIELSNGTELDVYCNMSFDGGGWTLVFNHSVGGGYFSSESQALLSNVSSPSLSTSKYSILKYLSYFKSGTYYEFKMNWKGYSKYQQWKQTSNPTTSKISGYKAVSISSTSNRWGGLERTDLYYSSSPSLMDGSVGHANWFYAVGSYRVWNEGIPASDTIAGVNTGANNVNLWVR